MTTSRRTRGPCAGGVSAATVKQLRDATGAGMMDCKKALQECEGSIEEATAWLRKKGMASADKKAGRIAAEGGVVSYIHAGSRIGRVAGALPLEALLALLLLRERHRAGGSTSRTRADTQNHRAQ